MIKQIKNCRHCRQNYKKFRFELGMDRIPRFAYKITSGYHTSEAGTIEIVFIDTDNNPLNAADKGKTIEIEPSKITFVDGKQDKYLVHPAFTSNSDNGGGFDNSTSAGNGSKGISGFWFAKFETSKDSSENYKSIAGEHSLVDTPMQVCSLLMTLLVLETGPIQAV